MLRHLTAARFFPLVSLATACSAVRSVRSPAEFIPAKTPVVVWVTKTDNSVVPLERAQIRADILAGFFEGDSVEVPLSSVQSIRARQPAPARTVFLVGGLTLAAAVVTAQLLLGKGPSDTGCPAEDQADVLGTVC